MVCKVGKGLLLKWRQDPSRNSQHFAYLLAISAPRIARKSVHGMAGDYRGVENTKRTWPLQICDSFQHEMDSGDAAEDGTNAKHDDFLAK